MRANGTATANSSKDLVKEISVLKAQLKKLSSSIEKDASNGLNGALSDIQAKSKETIDEVIETAQAFLDDYSDSAKETTKALMAKSASTRGRLCVWPSRSSSIMYCRTCWPECQVVRSSNSCRLCGP